LERLSRWCKHLQVVVSNAFDCNNIRPATEIDATSFSGAPNPDFAGVPLGLGYDPPDIKKALYRAPEDKTSKTVVYDTGF
jgi:hypothetical protein